LRPINTSPAGDRSYRDWKLRTLIVEHALQRSLGRTNNSAASRLEALSPLSFNAAVDDQRIFGAHWVNLADTLVRAS
jgi:hypothetical protein